MDKKITVSVDWQEIEQTGCTLSMEEFETRLAAAITAKYEMLADVECDDEQYGHDIVLTQMHGHVEFADASRSMVAEQVARGVIERMIERLAKESNG